MVSIEPLIISERQSRNAASKAIDKKIHKISENGLANETIYQETGFLIGQFNDSLDLSRNESCKGNNLVLCSPSIWTNDFHNLVGLNKLKGNDSKPSCAAIASGKLKKITSQGFDDVISVYHGEDDHEIFGKNEGSVFIHAWLGNDNLKYKNIMIYEGMENKEAYKEKEYSAKDILSEAKDRSKQTGVDQFLKSHNLSGVQMLKNGRKVSISTRPDDNISSCIIP